MSFQNSVMLQQERLDFSKFSFNSVESSSVFIQMRDKERLILEELR